MNQEKIGKYVAECRKKKNLTQIELAERLNVSNRSISKWENGICMPDISMFKPLCFELGITINDLLNGEKIKENYIEKSDENISNFIEDIKLKNKRKKKIIIFLLVLIVSFLIFLSMEIILDSEVKVPYDERIMNCTISDKEIYFEVNGLSIIHSNFLEKEINNEMIYFVNTKMLVKNELRSHWETWEGMAKLINGEKVNFKSFHTIDIDGSKIIKVYHTDKSLNKIKKMNEEELEALIKNSNLMCQNY